MESNEGLTDFVFQKNKKIICNKFKIQIILGLNFSIYASLNYVRYRSESEKRDW